PGRARGADSGRRLMIAEDDEDDVAAGMLAQVSRERRVRVRDRVAVAWREVRPVGLLRVRADHSRAVPRMRVEDPLPGRLIRRRRAERKVRADRWIEHEQVRPRRAIELERIELRERELIGDRKPAELRAAVIETSGAVDVVEAVEGAFGPALTQARH